MPKISFKYQIIRWH